MNATHERRTALLRAYGLDLDLGTLGDDEKGIQTVDTLLADDRERRVLLYAARIAEGLPLRPGQRLTRRDRAELAKTDPDAPTVGTRKRAGRKSLASRTDRPFAERLNRDCREAAAVLAKRIKPAGTVPVPAVVREQFPTEADLADKWAAHVRELAARTAGHWRGVLKLNRGRDRAK